MAVWGGGLRRELGALCPKAARALVVAIYCLHAYMPRIYMTGSI